MEFKILTCIRTSDVRNGKWRQIDCAQRMWTIPEMSKIHCEHGVPFSHAALAVLDKVQQITREIGGHIAQSEYPRALDMTPAPESFHSVTSGS
ncbi:hypothetical protein [Pseudorhodoplanes sp.]|uniref:hypothetical protein n=1 Tax=Pseudorhodoplanes sp. TaxID=1934341 RepID=UPI0039C93271